MDDEKQRRSGEGVTSKVDAERAPDVDRLMRAQQRLEHAQALAHVGSWEYDYTTQVAWWSAETFRIIGWEPRAEPPAPRSYFNAVHPDDRARLDMTYERSIAEKGSYDIEHRIVTPDGRVKHVRAQVRTVFAENGAPLQSEGTLQDITELVESRLLRQNIIGGVLAFVVVFDRGGRRVETNYASIEELRAHSAKLLGEVFWEGYAWTHSAEAQAQVRAAFESALAGETARGDFVARMADGRLVNVDGAFCPLRDSNGQIIGVVGSGVDITERKKTEARLREREARLSAVFNNTSNAMVLLSVDPDGELRVVAANPLFVAQAAQFAAVEEADLIGKPFSYVALEIFKAPKDLFEQHQASRKRAIEARTSLTFEHSVLLPAGRFFSEVKIVPIFDNAGKCTQVLWSSRDITAAKQAEAQLRASLAEKETLVREIHHRVKNNLQVISSLLHFQSKKHGLPEDAAAFAELRQRILAMTLVHERLYQAQDVTRVEFGDYVRSLVEGISSTFEPRPDVRIDVVADEVRLPIELALPCGMTVCELITNVYKYAFPEGRSGVATVSVRAVGDRVVLKVDDDGVGFPEGFSSAAKGSFGWNLIRALTSQLDGTVEAMTDHGAHVRISFPAPDPAPEPT